MNHVSIIADWLALKINIEKLINQITVQGFNYLFRLIQLLPLWHSPLKLVLVYVRCAISNINALSYGTVPFCECIHLNNRVRDLLWDNSTSHEYHCWWSTLLHHLPDKHDWFLSYFLYHWSYRHLSAFWVWLFSN